MLKTQSLQNTPKVELKKLAGFGKGRIHAIFTDNSSLIFQENNSIFPGVEIQNNNLNSMHYLLFCEWRKDQILFGQHANKRWHKREGFDCFKSIEDFVLFRE